MNTDQLDRAIRLYAKRFDGVFSSDRLPTKPRLMVCNTDRNIRTKERKMSYLPVFQITEIVSQHGATTARAAALQRRLYTQQPMARGDCSDD